MRDTPVEVRQINGLVFLDKRKFYKFKLQGGGEVETKAASEKEAKKIIEECLSIELEEAA